MKVVSEVFASREEARDAVRALRTSGTPEKDIAILYPNAEAKGSAIPVTLAEQPGMGKAISGSVGAAAGLAGGFELGTSISVLIPGVGPVLIGGYLGAALVEMGAPASGLVAGGKIEDVLSAGLPENELHLCNDALRAGRYVVFAHAENAADAENLRALMKQQGADTLAAARHQGWLGLRDLEKEHYTAPGRDFQRDEVFYRCGFEAALHARFRGKEYDQVLSEMDEDLEELKAQCPGVDVEEAFRRGYERGLAYNEAHLKKAAG